MARCKGLGLEVSMLNSLARAQGEFVSDAVAQWSKLRRRRPASEVEIEAFQMEYSLVHSCQIESRKDSIAWLVGLDTVVYPWSRKYEKVAFLTFHEQRKTLDFGAKGRAGLGRVTEF